MNDLASFDDLPPEIAAERMRLARRARMAEALAQQSMQPLQGRMVGRFYVPPSPMQGLAQVGGAFLANKDAQTVEKDFADLGKRYGDMQAAEIERIRRLRSGTPAATGTAAMENMEAGTPANPQAAVEAALTSQFPNVRRYGGAMLQSQEAAENRAARLQERMLVLEAQAENNALNAQQRAEAARRADETRLEIARLMADTRREIANTDAGKPFAGRSVEAQALNILLQGDPASPEYAAAYNRQAAPRMMFDSQTGAYMLVTPDMSAYRKPTATSPAPAAPQTPSATEPGAPSLRTIVPPPPGAAEPSASGAPAVPTSGANFRSATGVPGFLNWLGNVITGTGATPGGMRNPDVARAQTALENLRIKTQTTAQSAIPGRPSNYLMQELDKMTLRPGSVMQGPEQALITLQQTRDLFRSEIERLDRDIISRRGALPRTAIAEAEQAKGRLSDLMRDYDAVIEQMQPPPPSDLPPPPSGISADEWPALWGTMTPQERALWRRN